MALYNSDILHLFLVNVHQPST